MKIGIISDIHGNSPALAAVLPRLLTEVDQVLFLGDLCGYYPFVNECVALWDQDRILGVRGNHDQVLLDCLEQGADPSEDYQSTYGSSLNRDRQDLSSSSLSLLQALPISLRLEFDGVALSLYHGAPWDPLEGRVYPDFEAWDRFSEVPADIILMGHTHYPFSRCHGDQLIVNPGSVGQPRDRSGAACYATLDLEKRSVQQHRVPFDSRQLIDDAREHDPDVPYLVEVLIRK